MSRRDPDDEWDNDYTWDFDPPPGVGMTPSEIERFHSHVNVTNASFEEDQDESDEVPPDRGSADGD